MPAIDVTMDDGGVSIDVQTNVGYSDAQARNALDGETVTPGQVGTEDDPVDESHVQSQHSRELFPKLVGGTIRHVGAHDGADHDERFEAALTAAQENEIIQLEPAELLNPHTVSSPCTIRGAGGTADAGTQIEGAITLDARIHIEVPRMHNELTVNGDYSTVQNTLLTNEGSITVNAPEARLIGLRGSNSAGEVTFASGTSKGIVDASTNVAVTDNGNNTVGDIS